MWLTILKTILENTVLHSRERQRVCLKYLFLLNVRLISKTMTLFYCIRDIVTEKATESV